MTVRVGILGNSPTTDTSKADGSPNTSFVIMGEAEFLAYKREGLLRLESQSQN